MTNRRDVEKLVRGPQVIVLDEDSDLTPVVSGNSSGRRRALEARIPEIEAWLEEDRSRLSRLASDGEALALEMAKALNLTLPPKADRDAVLQSLGGVTFSQVRTPVVPAAKIGTRLLELLSVRAARDPITASLIAGEPLTAIRNLATETNSSPDELATALKAFSAALDLDNLSPQEGFKPAHNNGDRTLIAAPMEVGRLRFTVMVRD